MRLDLTYGIGGGDTSGPSRCLMLPLVMATSCEALRLEDFCRDKSKTGLIECCADAPGIGSVSWFVVLYCLLGYVAIPFLGLCSFLRGVHLEHCVHVRGWSKDVLVRQGRGMVQYLQRVRVLLSGLGLSESTRSLRECSFYVLARGAGGLGAAFVLWRALQGFTTASCPGLPGTVAFAVLCILLHCLAGSGTDYIQLIASQLVIHIPCLGQLFDHLMGLCVCCSAPSAYLCLHV